jgi:hypothetical protein
VTDTCFVLGSGFSSPAALPVQQNLLAGDVPSEISKDLKKIFNISGDLKPEVRKEMLLEDIFTFLDKVTLGNEKIAGFDFTSAHEAQVRIIEHIIKNINTELKKLNHKEEYGAFFDSLVHRKINGRTNSIVTPNWDTLPEYYINRAYKKFGIKGGVDYGCYDWDINDDKDYVASILRKASGYSTIKVLKLHGSINWLSLQNLGGLYVKEPEQHPS